MKIATLKATAQDRCEGCRLSWRLKGWMHGEPMPIECEAKEQRQKLREMERAHPSDGGVAGEPVADDDRRIMGAPEAAKLSLIEKTRVWIALRQPSMDTAKGHRETEAREREARFQLANAAAHWLWHEDHPALPPVPGNEGREAAIEECAKVADKWLEGYGDRDIQHISAKHWEADAVRDIADAIRALSVPRSEGKTP